MMPKTAPDLSFLLASVDEAFDRSSWHGPNLRASLRDVSPEQAAARPAPGRHNIWELMLHAAYWKFDARRRLTGDRRARFALRGKNWFPTPSEATAEAWKRDLGILLSAHAEWRAAAAAVSAADLADPKRRAQALRLIRGVAAHDLYHAGQIQLLKRLCPVPEGRP